jgi:hypothetical protein
MNRYIAEQINKKMAFNIIDLELYSTNKSLRLPNTPKFNTKDKCLENVYHKIVRGKLSDMYVTDISSIQNSLSNAIGFINLPHKEIGYENVTMSE